MYFRVDLRHGMLFITTGCTSVYTMQPVVQPAVQPVVQPAVQPLEQKLLNIHYLCQATLYY